MRFIVKKFVNDQEKAMGKESKVLGEYEGSFPPIGKSIKVKNKNFTVNSVIAADDNKSSIVEVL
jgi:hypothetical protein